MADPDGQARRGPEQCCDEACNGGACETCRCCCAGWCVLGTDGLPEYPADLARWIEVAREHNPIVEAWAASRAEVERLRAQRDAVLGLADGLQIVAEAFSSVQAFRRYAVEQIREALGVQTDDD